MLVELLPVLLPLLLECLQRDGEDRTVERLRKRPGLIQWRVFRASRKSGADRECARQCAREAVETIEDMSDDDLRDLLSEARGT